MGEPREEVNGTTTRPRLPLQGRAATRARDLISCHHADLLGLSALITDTDPSPTYDAQRLQSKKVLLTLGK